MWVSLMKICISSLVWESNFFTWIFIDLIIEKVSFFQVKIIDLMIDLVKLKLVTKRTINVNLLNDGFYGFS